MLGEICIQVVQQNLNCEWGFVANEVLKEDNLWFYRLRKFNFFLIWIIEKKNALEH